MGKRGSISIRAGGIAMSQENTIITVHGYQGDQHQIRTFLPLYEHHKSPVIIFSPDDSRIEDMGGHGCWFGGKRAYVGPDSIQREKIHLKMMLDLPGDYFLRNDSDSFCICPDIPEYLYEEDAFYSNVVSDAMHQRLTSYKFPRLAFQPPYFFSRRILQRMVSLPDIAVDQTTPFPDWFFMAACVAGGIPYKNFRDGFSCCTRNSHGLQVMSDMVGRHGKVMLHSIKSESVMKQLLHFRKRYANQAPPITPGNQGKIWTRQVK